MKTVEKRRQADIRGQLGALKKPLAGFAGFMRSHWMMALCIAIILVLVYGGQAFSNYFYIDKEVFVNNPRTYYNWGETGRFGLIFINRFFGMGWYNPYVAGILFLAGLWLAAMMGGYLFYMIEPELPTPILALFMLLFMIFPTYVEMFLFQFVAYEIVTAMVFMLAADWLFVLAVREKNIAAFAASLPLMVITFGSYQSLVMMQLCLYMGIFLMLIYTDGEEKMLSVSIGYSIVHFAAAFGISELISRCFFSGSDYVNSMVAWQSGDYETCLRYIGQTMYKVVTLKDPCYPVTYDLCWGIGLAALVILLIRRRRWVVWYGLGLLGVVLSPFFLLFVMGQPPMYRMQLSFPVASAFLFLFSIHVILREVKENRVKAAKGLFVLMGCAMLFLNIKPMMRLFYTRDVVGKADEMTAALIIGRLNDISSVVEGEKPVVFIGRKPAMLNASCYTMQNCWTYTIMSAFDMDYAFEPYYYYSTQRILGYFRTLGVQYISGVAPEDMPSAYEDSEDMPIWPEAGSVEEFEDYVIVKLGETELPAVAR